MTWYEFWLFVHVTAVIAWVGGAGAIQVFGVLTKRAADPAKTAFFARNVSWTVLRVFLPASILVFIAGVGLVETVHWDWGEPFIVVGIVLWAAVSLVAFGYLAEVPWLQPYPDDLLEGFASGDDEPEAELVARGTIELAFIAAIQLLPPKQRAVLISRDVLGWTAAESATLLDLSVAAVNSALQRARATLKQHLPRHRVDWAPGNEPSPQERALLQRYMDATDQGDPEAIRRLLRADALFAMPPEPRWYVGPDAIVESWLEGGFGDDSWGHLRCIPTRVNRQPAVACYLKRAGETEYRPLALDVLRIEDGAVAEIVAFDLEPLLARLGLPATL